MNSDYDNHWGSTLRMIDKADGVFSADVITDIGFGSTIQTILDCSGAVVTRESKKIFQTGPCNCLLALPEQFGGICEFCRYELEQINLQLPPQDVRSFEKIAWLSRPCKDHLAYCAACRVGICTIRHGVQTPDGNAFCLPHFEELSRLVKDN